MLKNLQKTNKGFTIVEVMIVLAIAGLIILVVLLAVPALQRNSRNASIKNDASAVSGVVNEFQSVNNGRMPGSITITNGVVTATGTGLTAVNGKVQGGTTGGGSTTATMPTAAGVVNARIGSKCNDAGTALGPVNGRAVAVMYLTETSNATATQCLDS